MTNTGYLIPQAARLLRVSQRNLVVLCRKGCFDAVKRGRTWVLKLPSPEQTITPSNVAEALGCTQRFVEKLCADQRVTAFRVGRLWRMPISDATKLMIMRLNGSININQG